MQNGRELLDWACLPKTLVWMRLKPRIFSPRRSPCSIRQIHRSRRNRRPRAGIDRGEGVCTRGVIMPSQRPVPINPKRPAVSAVDSCGGGGRGSSGVSEGAISNSTLVPKRLCGLPNCWLCGFCTIALMTELRWYRPRGKLSDVEEHVPEVEIDLIVRDQGAIMTNRCHEWRHRYRPTYLGRALDHPTMQKSA